MTTNKVTTYEEAIEDIRHTLLMGHSSPYRSAAITIVPRDVAKKIYREFKPKADKVFGHQLKKNRTNIIFQPLGESVFIKVTVLKAKKEVAST